MFCGDRDILGTQDSPSVGILALSALGRRRQMGDEEASETNLTEPSPSNQTCPFSAR